ncbi:hypothetical protein AAKU55_003590 [Oxalobacteraceae bacterium GrIS 1.11]
MPSIKLCLQLLLGAAVLCSGASAQAEPNATGTLSFADVPPEYAAWTAQLEDCVDEEAAPLRGDVLLAMNTAGGAIPQLTVMDYEPSRRKEPPVQLAALHAKPARPAPAPTAPVAVVAPPAPKWEIKPIDRTLNVALARWAASAGWQLLWEVPVDYAVEAETTIPGTFEQAVETVTKSMETAEIPLKAIFYKGNNVIRIVVKGAE